MLAQRFLNLVGSLFLFLDGKYLVEKKSDCLVLDRFTYANITPGMLTTGKVICLNVSILILLFGICSGLLKIYRPDYTSCSPWEVNFFLSAKVLVSLKYKNILHLRYSEILQHS